MTSPAQTQELRQSLRTEGLTTLERPSLITRVFMRIVTFAERLNVRYSKVGNPAVYDNATFPWAAQIEREWPLIRTELEHVLQRQSELPGFHQISTDVSTITQDMGWKTFFFCGYGARADANIAQCPQTWRIVNKVPGLITAMFSILEPGKHIPHHRGPYNGVLRLHVGLIIPEPHEAVKIRVGNQMCHWAEGKALIFDDAYDHEAWNGTDKTRVVLFVDFVKPLRFPANLVNWVLLNLAVFTPFVSESSDNHKSWEKKFYAEAEAYRNR